MVYSTFISHRHGDSAIADVLRTHLQLWNIPGEDIFQSSYVNSGLRIGDALSDLGGQLKRSSLVILVYTFADLDWSYCMWECGVATDPEKKNTRTIVLQCTEDKPRVFRDQLLVKATHPSEVERFVLQVHKEAEFWPGEPALNDLTEEEILKRRSSEFYEDLRKAIPEGRLQHFDRWDSLKLTLAKEDIEEIKAQKWNEGDAEVIDLIASKSIVADEFGLAPRHFGYERFPSDLTLDVMYRQWLELCQEKGDCPDGWLRALCLDIWTAANEQPARPSWQLLHSAMLDTDFWFHIVLSQKVLLPDSGMSFNVYMHRIPTAVARAKASVDLGMEAEPPPRLSVGGRPSGPEDRPLS